MGIAKKVFNPMMAVSLPSGGSVLIDTKTLETKNIYEDIDYYVDDNLHIKELPITINNNIIKGDIIINVLIKDKGIYTIYTYDIDKTKIYEYEYKLSTDTMTLLNNYTSELKYANYLFDENSKSVYNIFSGIIFK